MTPLFSLQSSPRAAVTRHVAQGGARFPSYEANVVKVLRCPFNVLVASPNLNLFEGIEPFKYIEENRENQTRSKVTYGVSHNIGSTLLFFIFSGFGAQTEKLLTFFQQPWKFAT